MKTVSVDDFASYGKFLKLRAMLQILEIRKNSRIISFFGIQPFSHACQSLLTVTFQPCALFLLLSSTPVRISPLSLRVTGVLTAVCAEQQPRSTQRFCSLFGFSLDSHPGDLLPLPPHPQPFSDCWSLLIVSLQGWTEVKVISTLVQSGLQMSACPEPTIMGLLPIFSKLICRVNVVIS